ncbi:hypothetical protein [Tortoise microvirus 22]|nr:hypothetical protein [Tortoise microvirus 22]
MEIVPHSTVDPDDSFYVDFFKRNLITVVCDGDNADSYKLALGRYLLFEETFSDLASAYDYFVSHPVPVFLSLSSILREIDRSAASVPESSSDVSE